MNFDGRDELNQVLKRAGFETKEQAVASLVLFVHPDTVAESQNKPLFRIVRDFFRRGEIVACGDGGRAMACDNTGPTDAFRWAVGGIEGADIQYNHIYSRSRDVGVYTALGNVCVTPSFLAKLTDQDEKIVRLLKFRTFDQYGFLPTGEPRPDKPDGYDALKWRDYCPVVGKLESLCLNKMRRSPRNRASISARELGWLFSDFKPDSRI